MMTDERPQVASAQAGPAQAVTTEYVDSATNAVADSSVIAVYQRQVELVAKSWSRSIAGMALLISTGIVLIFALHVPFIPRGTKHVMWLMPLLLYVAFSFMAHRMLRLRIEELDKVNEMVVSDVQFEFTITPRTTWKLYMTTAMYVVIVMYGALWFCGMSLR